MASKPKNYMDTHRELLARADELDKFAKELRWLVARSMQCVIDGPEAKPEPRPISPPYGLDSAEPGPRMRAEKAKAHLSLPPALRELVVLLSTLDEMANRYQQTATIKRIWAGNGRGRPRSERAVLAEIDAALGNHHKVKASKKAGRPLMVDVSDSDLDRLVGVIHTRGKVTWRRACWLAARWYLTDVSGKLAPNAAAWRLNSEVPAVAKNIERRMLSLRAKARKPPKKPSD